MRRAWVVTPRWRPWRTRWSQLPAPHERPRYAPIVPGSLPERPDPAQHLGGAERGGDLGQVGTLPRPGEQDPDDLGSFPDRAWVGLRVLLVGLLVGGEAEVCRELADLAEPFGGIPSRRLVVAGERVGDGADQVGVQAAEPGIGGIGDHGEQLREEVAVDGPEVGPLAQVLTRIVGVLALDGQGARRQEPLGLQDRYQVGIVAARPD